MKSASLFIATIVLLPSSLFADATFFSPDSVSASNTNHPLPVRPENLIDGSGLDTAFVTLDNINSVFHSSSVGADLWRGSSAAVPITLTFNFNANRRVDYVGLWQGVQLREGTRDFNLRFWNDVNGTGAQIGADFAGVLDTGAGGDNSILMYGRSFDVGRRDNVRSMTMQINSIAHQVNPHVHLGEVMFANVPEPSAMGILLVAVGSVWMRRRRSGRER